jgi:hypothetical protein
VNNVIGIGPAEYDFPLWFPFAPIANDDLIRRDDDVMDEIRFFFKLNKVIDLVIP